MKRIIAAALAGMALSSGCYRSASTDETKNEGKKEGFELAFGDDFNAGMNHVDDLGISIVIAMDVSGSMTNRPASGGDAKYKQAVTALKTVTDYLSALSGSMKDIKVNVAILSFSSGVTTVLPLTRLDEPGREKMAAACVESNFKPKGETAIGKALERGSEILAQSGTIFNSLIVVTDGDNTIEPKPGAVMEAIYANRNNKTTTDSQVTTSTQLISIVTFDVDSPSFNRLNELGARIISASDREQLEQALKGILEADITKLE